MSERLIWGIAPQEGLLALATVAATFVAAGMAYLLLTKGGKRLGQKTSTDLVNALISAIEKPLLGAMLTAGFYLASLSLPLLPSVRGYTELGFSIVMSLLGIYAVLAVVDAFLHWYHMAVSSKSAVAMDDKLVRVLRVVAPMAAGLLALVAVLDIIGVNLAPVQRWLADHGSRLGLIVALWIASVLALDRAIPRLVIRTVTLGVGETDAERQKRAATMTRVLVTTSQVVAALIAGFMLLSELDMNIGPVLAGMGVAGLAFGFGGQYLIRDLIAGVFIITENQYRVGDVARVADIAGLVVDINLRRTVLRDLDGIVHVVPNGEIRVASNFTKEFSRVNLNISVAYGTDLDHAIAVINRVGQELAADPQWAPLLISTPQVLRVDALGSSGIDIKILGDTQPIQQWAVMGELRKRVKEAFDEEGIEIPWPHTKVFFGNRPPAEE